MNEPTLTDTERRGLLERAHLYAFPKDDGDPRPEWSALEGYVGSIKVEAVDRERAAWATKIETLADEYAANGAARDAAGKPAWPNNVARDLRGLLATDDTDEIHPSVQWVADAIAAAVAADDAEGKP